jgi:hypothetical protein
MQWEIAFSEDAEQLTIRAWGPAELAGFKAYFEAAVADPRWKPGIACLLEFSALSLAALHTDELRSLVDYHQSTKAALGGARIALVVSRAPDFGMARMWEVLSESLGLTQHVFYDLGEARAWLEAGSGRAR